ncbi:hypothetical protein [Telmatospirillum sp.]|uniref:hypothetical protein n=1 Tax=Telmatospirillum sp. TaxID=2079197 RepID=UPI0028511626|nr:hypothetical protein [Telmatospirillum sp.]MDR3439937.1 hypothetical protein [Telmatospirillum sp.]
MLRHAFPDAEVVFHAQDGHVKRLKPNLADVEGITFRSCSPFTVPFGLSRHNPLGGYLAARRCLGEMVRAVGDRSLTMTAVLGVDANLLSALRRTWPRTSSAPLHMILHNHLAAAARWRTRNPLYRPFDFLSALAMPMAPRHRLIALELGIKEATVELVPTLAPNVETLEHPILTSEWVTEREPVPGERLKIGFLGHASNSKGFDRFMEIARKSGPDKEFHAIGLGSPEALAMDLRVLARPPAASSVPRTEYVEALTGIDAVCLPLSQGYDYVASGSVIDAIVGLKPLFCLRNRSVEGIFKKYGSIGYLADTIEDLEAFVLKASMETVLQQRPMWVANLAKIRAARSPEALAPAYAASVQALMR